MAAAPVESLFGDLRETVDRKDRLPETRLDDPRWDESLVINISLAGRCGSGGFCRERDLACADSPPTSRWLPSDLIPLSLKHRSLIVLGLHPDATPLPYGAPPPSYPEAFLDAPPDYTSSGILAQARPLLQNAPQSVSKTAGAPPYYKLDIFWPMPLSSVDLGGGSNFTSHGGKKKKPISGARSNWPDDAGEKNNTGGGEGGAGEDRDPNGGGGAGGDEGGGTGGGGGGGDDGDGGDGDRGEDEWAVPGSKKKKKQKKTKASIDEEEEKRKKEEEEAGAEAEAKKKEREAATKTPGAFSLADDTNANANVEDDFGFVTAKKGKKGKKSKVDPEPAVMEPVVTNTFDEINLLDDSVPKIDLSFGDSNGKETSSGFGLGSSWVNWGPSAPKSWGLLGGDTASTDVTESKSSKDTNPTSADSSDGATWSFDGNKKNKKKTTTSGFDFGGFGELDDLQEEDTNSKVDNTNLADDADDWGTFTSVNKKDKKKKKSGTEELERIVAVLPEIADVTGDDDSWNAWESTKKDKKKNGKAFDATSVLAPSQHSPPDPPIETKVEDEWAGFGAKKDKKKSKKNSMDEPFKIEETVAPAVVILEPEEDKTWESFVLKKDKKNTKKVTVKEQPKAEETFAAVGAVPGPDRTPVDNLGSFTMKKDKKKGRKGAFEETKSEEPAVVVVPEAQPEADTAWGTAASKKERKKGKKADEPAVAAATEKQEPLEDTWDIWGTASKRNEKAKKGAIGEANDNDNGDDDDDEIEAIEPPSDEESDSAEADTAWMDWNKKKEKKKGGAAKDTLGDLFPSPPPPPPPAPISFLDTSKDEQSTKKGKDKKGKKGKTFEPEPAVVAVPDPVVEPVVEPVVKPFDDDLTRWTTSTTKEKKKRDKELEKEREERRKDEERLKEEDKKKEADKKKTSRKPVGEGAGASKANDLLAGSVPDTFSIADDDNWGGAWGSFKKDKKKGPSKVMEYEVPPAAPTPPAMGLTPEPEEAAENVWGTIAPVKAKGKKEAKGASLTRTTSVSKALDSKDARAANKSSSDKGIDFLSTLDDFSDDKPEAKQDAPKEDTPAKAARSFWGSMGGGTPTTKAKTAKEKEKEKKEKEKQEALAKEAQAKEDAEMELLGLVDSESEPEPSPLPPPPKSASKARADIKLTRTNSKGSDKAGKADKKKAETEALVDIVEETAKEVKDAKGAIKSGDGKGNSDDKGDAWNFFGATKKTGVKKGDEVKKEITKSDATNQKAATKKGWNEPEEVEADEAEVSKQPSKSSKTPTMKSLTNTKVAGAGKLSVAEKIKALERDKAKEAEAKPTPPPPPPPEPQLKETKSKLTRTTTSSSKKKDLSPTATKDDPKKSSKDSVPGSFPSEGNDDDTVDVIQVPPPDKKSKAKAGKAKKDKEIKMDDFIVEAPAPPPAPPTPPPEPMAARPAKKERARVVRDEGASSWGFWGASPKKDVKKASKSKDDTEVSPSTAKEKAPAPGLGRSKSVKTAKEKEKEDVSRSSASDKDKAVESPRPTPKSRGTSFSFFGAPSPARKNSVRRSSTAPVAKSTSRQQSVDVGTSGMPSPPLDDAPEMNTKAAKLMGMGSGKLGRKESTRGKEKARGKVVARVRRPLTKPEVAVPDPYPIDDDDMPLVNGLEDPVINAPIPKKSSSRNPGRDKMSRSKSTREVSPQRFYPLPDRTRAAEESSRDANTPNGKARTSSKYAPETADDDVVMAEAGPSTDGPGFITSPDDAAYVEKPRDPPPLKRSATSAKKSEGLKGLFGFRKPRRNSDTYERPKSKAIYADEDVSTRRKRSAVDGGDDAKRPRRDERSRRRGEKRDVDVDPGFVTDAAPTGGASTETEDAEARREARRARRAEKEKVAREARRAELKELEERKARRQLNDKAATEARKAKIREAREREAKAREEKESKRSAGDEEPEDKNDVARDLDPQPTERRSKHRSRAVEPQKTDRRRSYMDKPTSSRAADGDADRRARHDDRRSHRTPTEKPMTSRRKSAPVEDYFDPRNGTRGVPPAADPYLNDGANDHTSSWVNNQIEEPPPPPPIEPTVIEPPPVLGNSVPEEDDAEEIRRARRRSSKRRSRYVDAVADDTEERRKRRERREKEIKSSEGSGEGDRYARRRSEYRSPDAAAGAGKRASGWFKKMTNL